MIAAAPLSPTREHSPMSLTNRELLREAEEVARRISHSKDMPMRDVMVVLQLAARLKTNP